MSNVSMRNREEILELLDDVSAAAENMFHAFKHQMTEADRIARDKKIAEARWVCDEELRGETAP
jgi:hypothetical protein